MSPLFSYQSDLFTNLPDNSGYLALYISESKCDIAICSSSFVLLFLEQYQKQKEQNQVDFLKQLFASKQSLFSKHFQHINIGFNNANFTLLPSTDESNNEELFFLTDKNNEKVDFSEIPSIASQLVYSIPQEVEQVVNQSFENPNTIHFASHAIELSRLTPNYHQLLLIDDNYFDLIVKKDQHLFSINRHHFQTADDVTYFTLLGLKDAGIDPHDAKIIVSGQCNKTEELHSNLLSFVQQVDVKKVNNQVIIRSDFDQPHHFAENVLNLLHANY